MATKKQKQMISKAIGLIKTNQIAKNTREWENLFEDGENNTNAVIMGIIKEIHDTWWKDKTLIKKILIQSGYMPEVILRYARQEIDELTEENSPFDFILELQNIIEQHHKNALFFGENDAKEIIKQLENKISEFLSE